MLRKKLSNLKMQEGTSMTVFLQELRELLNEFACVGEKLVDSKVVEQVLMSLPESFDVLVNTMTYQAALPSISELMIILLQDEQWRELRSRRSVITVGVRSIGCTLAQSLPRSSNGEKRPDWNEPANPRSI